MLDRIKELKQIADNIYTELFFGTNSNRQLNRKIIEKIDWGNSYDTLNLDFTQHSKKYNKSFMTEVRQATGLDVATLYYFHNYVQHLPRFNRRPYYYTPSISDNIRKLQTQIDIPEIWKNEKYPPAYTGIRSIKFEASDFFTESPFELTFGLDPFIRFYPCVNVTLFDKAIIHKPPYETLDNYIKSTHLIPLDEYGVYHIRVDYVSRKDIEIEQWQLDNLIKNFLHKVYVQENNEIDLKSLQYYARTHILPTRQLIVQRFNELTIPDFSLYIRITNKKIVFYYLKTTSIYVNLSSFTRQYEENKYWYSFELKIHQSIEEFLEQKAIVLEKVKNDTKRSNN